MVCGFNEFLVLMSKSMNDNKMDEDMVEVFKTFDLPTKDKPHGKGHINMSDLKRVMKEWNENMSPDEFQLLFETTDRDRDGMIDFDDFVKMMMAL